MNVGSRVFEHMIRKEITIFKLVLAKAQNKRKIGFLERVKANRLA